VKVKVDVLIELLKNFDPELDVLMQDGEGNSIGSPLNAFVSSYYDGAKRKEFACLYLSNYEDSDNGRD
jgi:hypothetical protein